MVVGRSWEGIAFGAPDGNPTYLFFLLGLKYDRLHLPILGRLARALRNPATIAKLRSLSSPDQVRALLLKEDAAVRAGLLPDLHEAFKPKLDRQLRLRAIRRLQQAQVVKKAESMPAPAKTKKARAKAAKAAKAAAPKPAPPAPPVLHAPPKPAKPEEAKPKR
jgi:hypothetical protein